MTYLALAVSLALVTFLAVEAVCSALAGLVWRAARRDVGRSGARARADGLFLLAIFPSTAAVVVVLGIVLPAYVRFEPRETSEMMGESLVVLAVLSAAVILAGAWRGWLASRATRRLLRGWLGNARPVALPGIERAYNLDEEFPVVSVIGIVRPRMFVSARVLRECTAEEVSAMVAHERGHLAASDNLRRLVLRICPNLLSLTRAGRELDRHWQDACEEAADEFAARASTPPALALAAALLRVARMAPDQRQSALVGSALYEGDGIERRVRRLIGSEPVDRSRPAWLFAARVLVLVPPIFAAAALLDPRLLHTVHHVIEAVVETLP